MTLFEIIAALFSLVSIYYFAKNDKWSWPLRIVGLLIYLILFYQIKLYIYSGFQFIYLIQSIFGWWYWSGGKTKNEPLITSLKTEDAILYMVGIVIMVWVLSAFLSGYTISPTPFLDAVSYTIGLMASWLLAKRKIQTWNFGIFAYIICIISFLYQGMYDFVGLSLIFIVALIFGLKEWNKVIIREENA